MSDIIEIADGETLWRFDRAFLESNWTCLWGRGCKGILDHPAEELGQGCCSVGAEMADAEEAMTISALASTIPVRLWQHHTLRDADDVFADDTRSNTKIVDGACIFLNRPGFAGGAGCALHLAAEAVGESPADWKPSVCWQLPIRVDWQMHDDGIEHATVRRWSRADWGEEGKTMAWCCTEADDAYVGERPVIDSLATELTGIAGEAVYVQLRERITPEQPGR
ncbi:MAG: hypothetical protein HY826_05960 [Actinobacteria bacterium]|nr:hypothetical protein [Actinomycetota bacterium]